MRRYTKHRAPALAMLLAACATTPRVDVVSEEAAIRGLSRQWAQAAMNKDAAAFVGFYADNATVTMPNMPTAVGRTSIRSMVDGMLAMPNLSFSFEPTTISVARSGDLAYDVGTYRVSFDGPTGRVDDAGGYTTIWRKMNGQWKAVSDMSVSTVPLPPPAPMPAMSAAPAAPLAPAWTDSDDMEAMAGSSMKWTDLTVPGMKPGVKMAVVHGNPAGSGDYTVRIRFPAGYEVAAHRHPGAEHVTIIQGALMVGMGERMDRAATKRFAVGDFVYLPANAPHFAIAQGVTVVQAHGQGPFEVHPVEQPR